MKKLPKAIAIVGTTATGKSDFAVDIARAVGGEVISADSRQVYAGLDLGTGKITKREMRGVPHHLLDVAHPKKQFTVSDFTKRAEAEMAGVIRAGHVPIVCGGTGFYVDALLSGSAYPEVAPNKKLRATLGKKTPAALFAMLKKLDPKRAKSIDAKNPVRLIRAIEIAKALGKVPQTATTPKWQTIKIGLVVPRDVLKEKIRIRLDKRIKAGMLHEAKQLHKNGLSWKRMEELGLEYRYEAQYLQGKITKAQMMEQLASEIGKYAKRQETWFKRDKGIVWIDPRKKTDRTKALQQIKKFLENKR